MCTEGCLKGDVAAESLTGHGLFRTFMGLVGRHRQEALMTELSSTAWPWPDLPPGPLGTASPDLARRLAEASTEPVTMPSGDQVPMIVRYEDVRAVLTSPASSRNLRAPGLPRMVSGTSLEDDPSALINQDPPEHTRYRR